MVGYCIHSFFCKDVRGIPSKIFRPRNCQVAAEVIPKAWLRLRKRIRRKDCLISDFEIFKNLQQIGGISKLLTTYWLVFGYP